MARLTQNAHEFNLDGLVGPTHNYAGLSVGNIASTRNQAQVSNPREAALQGLAKMKRLSEMGLRQGLLPPHERPHLPTLRKLGFCGTDLQILKKAAKQAPAILRACSSASSMWTANAATVAPSADTLDHRVHFTAANLSAKFHRSIEHPTTTRILQAIFKNPQHFTHHEALPSGHFFGDEGAANHTRFCSEYGRKGVQFFVFGRHAFDETQPKPKVFPARQTLEASVAITRHHRLKEEACVFAQQNPTAIDAGAFHNDVVAVGNRNLLFFHELAFLDSKKVLAELRRAYKKVCHGEIETLAVPTSAVSLKDAVKSYLFNSQLTTLPSGKTALIAPLESCETPSIRNYLEKLLAKKNSPIHEVHYLDVRQSMRNGGGPACLRLRVVLTAQETQACSGRVFFEPFTAAHEDPLFAELVTWVKKHYRDRLSFTDLADPHLLKETHQALDELTQLLKLGSIYPFQTMS